MSSITLEQLQVIIQAETKPFRDELAKMQNQMSAAATHTEKQTSRIKKAFAGIKGALAGLAIGVGLFKLGKDAIGMASDLQEVQNVVDTAFGDMAYKCEAFAKTAIKQFGMSELSAKQTASTYMAMAKSMGLSLDTASDMSIQLAALSGDVASYRNISQELADTKLKSVFTGETETLKDIGVVMTQVNLKQYAISHGISDNIEKMDQASLVMLRYKFVMDALKEAQGDYTKTFPSWANQVRYLKEQWKQLLGIIGNGLVAVFTPVIHVINTVLGKIIQFAQVVQAVFSSLFGKKGKSADNSAKKIGTSLGVAEDNAGGLNSNLDKTSDKAKKAAKAMGQLASIDEINNMSSSQNSDSGDAGGSSGGVDGIDFDLGTDKEADTSGIDKTVNKIKKQIADLKSFIDKYKAPITSAMAGIVAALGTMWLIKNWGTLVGPIKNLFTNIVALFGLFKDVGFFETFSAMFMGLSPPMAAVVIGVGAVVAALVYLWQTSDTFRANVTAAIDSLFGILQNLWDSVLTPLFSFVGDVFKTILIPIATFLAKVFVTAVDTVVTIVLSFWTNVLAPVANFLVDILAIALQGVINVWEHWKPVIETIFTVLMWIWDNALKPVVGFIKNTFIKIFESWGETINDLIPSVKDMFSGLITFFEGVFTLDITKIWDGIKQIFQGFDNFLSKVFSTDWSKNFGKFGETLNAFFATVKNIWNSIKKIFTGIIDFVAGIFTGDWDRAWKGVKTIFSGIFDGFAAIAKAPINAVIGIFNGLLDGINWCIEKINSISVDLPDWLGGAHIGFDIPTLGKIKYLARGAVVSKPTPAIFGEAGTEAVIPLENNTGWMAKIAAGISGFMHYDDEDINDLIILMQELIDIVRDKDTNVYVGIDGDDLDRSNRRAERLRKLRTG